ncbi:putative uncharacterized protein [Pseudomonas sp. StFLB209]|uniref:hypothetical protein n=1 Tax=Pseudomonas sp. StFLB209 TaxID=1028989 RepID=UPI0004F75BCF|nr:hypothetical protein [Pseudomonas sp. StFLB209]BAP45885.1 putative uncharacterized protein [Pseudomonas sp. StFLB209]
MNYSAFAATSLPSFVITRAFPLLGISTLFSLIAYTAPDALAIVSYTIAFFSIIAATIPVLLSTVSNTVARIKIDAEKMDEFFSGGFTLSLALGFIACLLCTIALAIVLQLPSAEILGSATLVNLSIIYIPAATLLPINIFLQSFSEATGKAQQSAKLKTLITITGIIYLTASFSCCPPEHFKYYALAYFLVTETLSLISFLSINKGYRRFSVSNAACVASPLLKKGAAIAGGMIGQKIYFFLVVERLAATNLSLNKELSVTMSIITLLTIPSLAFSQVHSIYTSSELSEKKSNYRHGLIWTAALSTTITAIIIFTGEKIFSLYSNNSVIYDKSLAWSLITFTNCSAFLALATGHLRALNRTTAPQLIINALMLGMLIPIVYAINWDYEKITLLLHLQASTLALAFFILHSRIISLQKAKPVIAPVRPPQRTVP